MLNTSTPKTKKINNNDDFLKMLYDARRSKERGIITNAAWIYYENSTYIFEFYVPFPISRLRILKLRYATDIKNWFFYTDKETGDVDLSQPCNKKNIFENFYSIVKHLFNNNTGEKPC